MLHDVDLSAHSASGPLSLYMTPRPGTLLNELRLSDRLALFESHGFTTRVVRSDRAGADELIRLAIQPRFRDYDQADLLTTRVVIASVGNAG